MNGDQRGQVFGRECEFDRIEPITRNASISSVTTIVPTSAAIADAVRPLTASAVISAPHLVTIANEPTTICRRAEAVERQDLHPKCRKT